MKFQQNSLNNFISKIEELRVKDEFIALDNLLFDIVKSFGFSTKAHIPVYRQSIKNYVSNSEVYQEAIDAILQYATYRNIDLTSKKKHVRPIEIPVVSERGLRVLSSIPRYSKLRTRLIEIRDFSKVKYRHLAEDQKSMSKLNKLVWNNELTISRDDFNSLRTRFYDFLVKIGEIAEFKKGDKNTPHIIKKLFRVSSGLGMNDHPILAQRFQREQGFLGSELYTAITVNGESFTGQLDGLFYDYEYDSTNKQNYVVDYKPNLRIDRGGDYFGMAIPQGSGYTLAFQEEADEKMKCIIFNGDAAIIFDPNTILPWLNLFYADYIGNIRENPWESLTFLLRS